MTVNELLRFPGLAPYGVNNRVTLDNWIKKEGAPAAFYLGKNTRAWFKKDWDDWLANRPKADPPPEIKSDGPVPPGTAARKPKPPSSPTNISEPPESAQVPNGRARA